MTQRVIHIAAETAAVRQSLRATLVSYDIGDVVDTSDQGCEGVEAVKGKDIQILVICTGPNEDVSQHTTWYRDAAPQSYLIGFAFNDDQADGYRDGNVDAVARSNMGREGFIRLMRKAAD